MTSKELLKQALDPAPARPVRKREGINPTVKQPVTPVTHNYLASQAAQENDALVGLDAKARVWSPYDDNGTPAIGPGLQFVNGVPVTKDTRLTQQELMSAHRARVQQEFDSLLTNAKYPGFAGAPIGVQQALIDAKYNTGNQEFPKFWGAYKNNDIDAMRHEIRTRLNKNPGADPYDHRRNVWRQGLITE